MHVICVDDEQPALDNFWFTVAEFTDIESLNMFQNGETALRWTRENKADVAFLDMEMPGLHGLELARKLKEVDKDIRVIFVTAYSEYALDAFGVDAVGYILKPYTRQEIRKELDKAMMYRPLPKKRVEIVTIPDFSISVDGEALHMGKGKVEELLAILVDRAGAGITSGEAISCLWPERPNDKNTQALYRVTFKRMMDLLKEKNIEDIIDVKGRERFIRTELVECDLYRILSGDGKAAQCYAGQYLCSYSWAEMRNAQLSSMLDPK